MGSGLAADTAALVRLNMECGSSALRARAVPNSNPFMPLIHVPTQVSTSCFLPYTLMSTEAVDVMTPVPVRSAEVPYTSRDDVLL